MSTNSPLLSIVLPTYNRLAFLPAAIQSIRDQEFTDWELVIVDDGSTDATLEHLVEVLIDRVAIRGVPKFLRSENGPEFVSRRIRNFLESIDVGTSYIEPGSPWPNGFVEIFNSRFRDECLNCDDFATVQEARGVIAHWRQTYNHPRPHASLDGLTPATFASRCAASTQAAALLASNRHTKPETIIQPIPS